MATAKTLLLIAFLALGWNQGSEPRLSPPAQDLEVVSPDGSLLIRVAAGDVLTYEVELRGQAVIQPSPISMTLDGGKALGPGAGSFDVERTSVAEVIHPVVPEKTGTIPDEYNGAFLTFAGGWGLEVRAYDDGVAFRFRVDEEGEVIVMEEGFSVTFPGDPELWFPTEEGFLTHSERLYEELSLSEVPSGKMASMPVLAALSSGTKVLITESDLQAYPGLYLEGQGGASLVGLLPAFPAAEEQFRDRTVRVTEREDYLARTVGPRTFPWRIFLVAEEDTELVESTLVYRLAPSNRIADPSWIRPGKVAWDWWNASSLHGVDFESGLNTDTYLYFIDFAADHGIEYIILDEGWSDPADFDALNPDMDLEAILAHGDERGVGIILWVVWKTLDNDLENTLDRFAAWGVKGIKVDFMQRDDQPMVAYYWRVAEAAADRHLLVDFHGSYKPSGLRRAYPNVLTREGVQGLEQSKWSSRPTPEHAVTLPYIRMVAGPMDYTPGAMRNAQKDQFMAVFERPMSLGTRVHQMAMYVVFESPLQMLADSPSNYLDNPECTAFITGVPTVWDETRVLSGAVGDWIAVARRRGDEWFLGAMTDWSERDLDLDLSFLGDGSWTAEVFADGPNAHRNAEDYQVESLSVQGQDRPTAHLAPGGGWVAKFTKGGS